MSVPEQKTVLSEINNRNGRKRRYSRDDDSLERTGVGGQNPPKRWKFDIPTSLLEEVGGGLFDVEAQEPPPNQDLQKHNSKRLSEKENLVNNNQPEPEAYKSDERESEEDFALPKPKVRKESEGQDGEEYFSKLCDEVILNIFSFLPRADLLRCAQVSTRFNLISFDDKLWTYLDLSRKTLPTNAINEILRRNVVVIKASQAVFIEPIQEPKNVSKNYMCKIQYLDLSMAKMSPATLAAILRYCRNLKKLSLEQCTLDVRCFFLISRNNHLEVLNLNMAKGVTAEGLHYILTRCKKMVSLNLGWAGIDKDCIYNLARWIPSGLERLNISGCRATLTDYYLIEILRRCQNLLEVDISDCTSLTKEVVEFICENFDRLEHLSMSRCYAIKFESIIELKDLPNLMYLDVFGTYTDSNLARLKREMSDDIGLNMFFCSSIARPTVGVRRNSIWGLKVRE